MKALLVASALLVSGFALSPAIAAPLAPLSAAPLSAAAGSSLESQFMDVQYRRDDRRDRRYYAGQRYRTAPNGWHRYERRPGDWRARRCGQVGPVWFCP